MKIELELNIVDRPDGKDDIYLNFWDSLQGNDIICHLVDGKLKLLDFDEKEITIGEFVNMVKERMNLPTTIKFGDKMTKFINRIIDERRNIYK